MQTTMPVSAQGGTYLFYFTTFAKNSYDFDNVSHISHISVLPSCVNVKMDLFTFRINLIELFATGSTFRYASKKELSKLVNYN